MRVVDSLIIEGFYKDTMSQVKRDDSGVVIPSISQFTTEAKAEWKTIKESYEDRIFSDDVPDHLKGYIAKSKGRVLRYALQINTLSSLEDNDTSIDLITVDSLRKAVKLSNYFELMNEKTINEAKVRDSGDWKMSLSKTPQENYLALIRKNPSITQKASSEKLKVSVRTIANYHKQLRKEGKIK